jgi:hypothetical protein
VTNKIFILSDKLLFNFDSNKILNNKYFITFYKKKTKNFSEICKKLKTKNYLILVFDNIKIVPLEKKIFFISSFLEIVNKQKIKNKIFICDVIKSKNLNSFNKLEKNIFIEIINSFNNMFSLNIIFSNYLNKEKKINLVKILKKFKIYN